MTRADVVAAAACCITDRFEHARRARLTPRNRRRLKAKEVRPVQDVAWQPPRIFSQIVVHEPFTGIKASTRGDGDLAVPKTAARFRVQQGYVRERGEFGV